VCQYLQGVWPRLLSDNEYLIAAVMFVLRYDTNTRVYRAQDLSKIYLWYNKHMLMRFMAGTVIFDEYRAQWSDVLCKELRSEDGA
jgi:hypothetical protein